MGSERYDLKNVEEAFGILKDEELKKVYERYVSDFEDKKGFAGIYISKKEILNSIKERVFDGLEERFKDIKSNISHLRKKGFEVNVIDFNLLRFPLKKKLLDSDFCLTNYNTIMDLFSWVEPEIDKLTLEMEKQEKERDFKEREEFQKNR